MRVERTRLHGTARLLTLAMQKVVGSSPIIRSLESPPETAGFVSGCLALTG